MKRQENSHYEIFLETTEVVEINKASYTLKL